MVLYMDRNTRSTHGYFILTKIKDTGKVKTDISKKKYPVKLENNKIIPTKQIKDEKLKREIEILNSLCNMAILKLKRL